MKTIFFVLSFFVFEQLAAQTCYSISNRTNGNGNSNTCGTPDCSVNAKTGHIDVNFGASCPGVIPTLQLISVTSGSLPSPFCFDPGNCISAGTVRYCFRGSNLPASGFMVIRFTQGATVTSCNYDVNGGSGAVLPIQLSYFNAKLENGNVLIKWRTEQELNNEKFEIERSDDKIFSVISTVRGQGNSSIPVDYEYTDASPLRGVNFYRLKQIDIDGKSSYSSIRRVDNRIDGIQFRQLFPNPANETVTIQLTTNKPVQLHARILNSSGQLLLSESKRLLAGDQNWPINLHRLAAGVYEIIITNNEGGVLSERLIKQ